MLLVFGTAGSCLILEAKSCAEDVQTDRRVGLELNSENNLLVLLKYYLLCRKLFTAPSACLQLFVLCLVRARASFGFSPPLTPLCLYLLPSCPCWHVLGAGRGQRALRDLLTDPCSSLDDFSK